MFSKIYIPPPPKLPDYDPAEDPPRWKHDVITVNEPIYQRRMDEKATRIGVQPKDENSPDWRGVIKSKIKPSFSEPEDLPQHTPNHYFWFDTPDYADPFKKLGFLARWVLIYGGGLTCAYAAFKQYNILVHPNVKLFRKLFTEAFMPIAAPTVVTGVSVISIANLRGKKDDMWNYVLAPQVYALYRAKMYGHLNYTRVIIPLLPLTLLTKITADYNMNFMPVVNNRSMGSINLLKPDGVGFFGGQMSTRLFTDPGREL